MTQDHQSIEPLVETPRRSGGAPIVIAGVVGACVLGVGMGLWARPADPAKLPAERPAPTAPPKPAALQIVVADEPAPIGQPLEVLPGDFAEPQPEGAAEPEIIAPHRSASGLVKVDAPIAAAPLVVAAAVKAEPKPEPVVKAAPVAAKPKASAAAKADAVEAEKARLAKAKLSEARAKARKAELAAKAEKAEKARVAKLAKLEKEKAARAKLARAEAAKKKAEPRRKLAAVVKAVKAAPKTLKDAASRKKPVALAEARPKATAKAKPAPKAKKPPPRVETAAKAPPARRVVTPRGEGPMRVARANPCAMADPGEALVCADPRLSARERQLQQAYRNAEAAGVPATALRRQQARWQQARAAAARDAPWAVEDVYVARISELNDLTRDAREN